MAKKQAAPTKTAAQTTAAAAPARVAKPRAPRVSSSKHSKAAAQEAAPVVAEVPVVEEVKVAAPAENRHEAIAKIAYGYWIARGYRGGNAQEDWIRAEREYLSKI